jgi:phosphoheptose isomerase
MVRAVELALIALGPVFSCVENGSESDAEHFAFRMCEGFPNQQMSDS